VAFASAAWNLVSLDRNEAVDIFRHDRETGETRLVSVSTAGWQAIAASGFPPSLSADGRYVAFQSNAPNLVLDDSNHVADVFVHDTSTGETRRVSVDSLRGQADGASHRPVISGDGRYVAFESSATNLVTDDSNAVRDIFVHDRTTKETSRVSSSSAGEQADAESRSPAFSLDGSCVVFESAATNLVAGDSNAFTDVFSVTLFSFHDRLLLPGWSLIAGGPYSDCAGATLFAFDRGRYRSVSATDMVPGWGYWVRVSASTTVSLTAFPAPLRVHLMPGWNLIGNATPGLVTLPAGRAVFVFDGTRYLSRTTLRAAEGAWLRSAVEDDLSLEP
jgi:hypothetical protein